MSGNTLNGWIKYKNIWGKLEVVLIENKMRENRPKWFSHVHRRCRDTIIRRTDNLKVKGISNGRGRTKITWIKTVRNNLKAFNLIYKIVIN